METPSRQQVYGGVFFLVSQICAIVAKQAVSEDAADGLRGGPLTARKSI